MRSVSILIVAVAIVAGGCKDGRESKTPYEKGTGDGMGVAVPSTADRQHIDTAAVRQANEGAPAPQHGVAITDSLSGADSSSVRSDSMGGGR